MFEKIDFSPGEVTYNDFNIDRGKPLDIEDDALKEDMFKVNYPNNYILDIGWYSGVNKFIIYIIKDFDWENPIEKVKCSDLVELEKNVEKSVCLIRSLL